ncbi:hypothetical protein ANANG_G00129740 [Anguilla anguilla]|uniref:U-box domain-containing protein n=1 Tax=Anguilla anguilla TaxID=7936 RepID=A0A9D3MF02_ANGAN|nr:hypothetical protein ANANG_G00129740 [Anguilla anguilla]
MKEILEAVFGLLIVPEAEDPLDSILAEQFQSSREQYEEEAQKSTKQTAATPIEDMEKELVAEDLSQAQAIEDTLTKQKTDPFNNKPLEVKDLKPNKDMRSMVRKYRESQIQESA